MQRGATSRFAFACVVGVGTKTKFDDGARVWDKLCLPTIVCLKLLHGRFGAAIPMSSRITGQISGMNERRLDLGGAIVVDDPLGGRPYS